MADDSFICAVSIVAHSNQIKFTSTLICASLLLKFLKSWKEGQGNNLPITQALNPEHFWELDSK